MLVRIIKPVEHRLKDARERVKICLCDHALRRATLGEYVSLVEGNSATNDLVGSLVEGMIGAYLSLFSKIYLNYLPSKEAEDEVDFVITLGSIRIPIEVKYQNNPTVSRGIKQYLEKPEHNAKFGLLLTKNTYWVKGNIIAIPVKNFLLLR